ncbi:nondiscriminating glutamyl-tRNA synthetase EARS2, mitochondrial [Ciona intestinalis]
MLTYSITKRLCLNSGISSRYLRRLIHKEVRVRFAPSPTGFLHIGGLRTALYNYLFARANNGKFIVRIEDTDQTRVVDGATSSLLSTLEWAGLHPDESPEKGGEFGPYIQSERIKSYQTIANKLVDTGAAYRCFCSQRRLSILKKDQIKRKETGRYDNRCRELTEFEINSNLDQKVPYVIRLRLKDEFHQIEDALFGKVSHNAHFEGDPVILKSDGFPTYHLANVVDDHMMQISHVIRGKEWLTSTTKHVQIYEALGWEVPTFMHLPLLINKDGSKLSKRQGDVYVEESRAKGYSPSALLNFMAYYGSGFPNITFPVCASNHYELLNILERSFNPYRLVLSDAIVDFSKLDDFSTSLTKHKFESSDKTVMQGVRKELYQLLEQKFEKELIFNQEEFTPTDIDNYLNGILCNRKGHIVKLNDLIKEEYNYLWFRPQPPMCKEDTMFYEFLYDFIRFLNTVSWEPLDVETIACYLNKHGREKGLHYPKVMKFLRKLLSGREQGPKIVDLLLMLNKRESLQRLGRALSNIEREIEVEYFRKK